MERPYFVASDAFIGNSGVELFDPEPRKSNLVLSSVNVDYSRFIRDLSDWQRFKLPAASEKLGISSNADDYVVVPTVAMPSDLPNRNGMAFPLEQLTGWMPDLGMPMYQSWIGMPTFLEHNNSDYTQAKGIILDCKMTPLRRSGGDIWKVVMLLAFDRSRDPVLANDILTGKRTCYSMGANAADFSCSICSNLMSNGQCEHVNRPSQPLRAFKEFNGVLAFNNVLNPKGFECSSVQVPAYLSASKTKPLTYITD